MISSVKGCFVPVRNAGDWEENRMSENGENHSHEQGGSRGRGKALGNG